MSKKEREKRNCRSPGKKENGRRNHCTTHFTCKNLRNTCYSCSVLKKYKKTGCFRSMSYSY